MMVDSYQAIYDAVRSRISGGNIGEVVAEAARQAFDIGYARDVVAQEIQAAAYQHMRPSAVFRPTLSIDGDQWCALLGGNLQEGLCAFGDTPEQAMVNFDIAFLNERTPKARLTVPA